MRRLLRSVILGQIWKSITKNLFLDTEKWDKVEVTTVGKVSNEGQLCVRMSAVTF